MNPGYTSNVNSVAKGSSFNLDLSKLNLMNLDVIEFETAPGKNTLNQNFGGNINMNGFSGFNVKQPNVVVNNSQTSTPGKATIDADPNAVAMLLGALFGKKRGDAAAILLI